MYVLTYKSQGFFYIYPTYSRNIYHAKNYAYKLEVLKSLRVAVGAKDSYKEWRNVIVSLTGNQGLEIKENTMIGTLNIFDLNFSRKNGDVINWT